jgi:hypothetical protein
MRSLGLIAKALMLIWTAEAMQIVAVCGDHSAVKGVYQRLTWMMRGSGLPKARNFKGTTWMLGSREIFLVRLR